MVYFCMSLIYSNQENIIHLCLERMRATTRVFIIILGMYIPLVFSLFHHTIDLYHRGLYSLTIIITYKKSDFFYNPNDLLKFIYNVDKTSFV